MIRISDILAFLDGEHVEYTFTGDINVGIDGFSSLSHYKPETFTWVKKQANLSDETDTSQITLAFISNEVQGNFQNTIATDRSKFAFFSTIEHFYNTQASSYSAPVGQFTYIAPEVKLGRNVKIGHNCVLDGDITIGDNTVIWHNVTIINRVAIGHDTEIQSGCCIGHDGFGYSEDENHVKTMVKHYGGVTIGNNVFLANNVKVSRGTLDDTIIEDGVKIDAFTEVGHNCHIEENAGLAYGCKLGGSTHICKNAYVSAATIMNQCVIGENAFVGLGANVLKDVPANITVVGNPAKPLMK
ncbi:MAG: hypothetical protein IKS87_01335 [Lachnospiraceae bacterium]|nr:hypothetical protein [Lachnospiraceae bacterium]